MRYLKKKKNPIPKLKVTCHVGNTTWNLARAQRTDFAYLGPSSSVKGNIILSSDFNH